MAGGALGWARAGVDTASVRSMAMRVDAGGAGYSTDLDPADDGDADCRGTPGHFCDDDGACWACGPSGDAVVLGAPCAAQADCGAYGICVTTWGGWDFPAGYCVVDADAFCCPEGSHGVWIEDDPRESVFCLKGCAVSADCREPGYTCSDGSCFPAE